MKPTYFSNLRRRADNAYREYRAILIIANLLTGQERRWIDRSVEVLPSLPRPRLNAEYRIIRQKLGELRRKLGTKADLPALEKLLSTPTRKGSILYVPKLVMESDYLSHYGRVWPHVASLPPHALIGIDTTGVMHPTRPETNWKLLEASLFEDMASLWNATLDAASVFSKSADAVTIKSLDALTRATARAAFALLEGYLSGLGYDLLLTETLPLENANDLAEWNQKTGRRRWLTLRDKLLRYPKIALGVEHPPLQEDNCPEMKFILEKEEPVRHALIHPTPKVEPWRETAHRQQAFYELTVKDTEKIVDAVINLIRKINFVVQERFGKVDRWLHDRGADGRFAGEVFR